MKKPDVGQLKKKTSKKKLKLKIKSLRKSSRNV